MKGLEALKQIKKDHKYQCDKTQTHFSIFNDTAYKIVEKELKALDIIKNKTCLYDEWLRNISNYNYFLATYQTELSREEFEILKEVLKK